MLSGAYSTTHPMTATARIVASSKVAAQPTASATCRPGRTATFALDDVTHPSLARLPIAVIVGAAGVALIHDTYRKV